MITAMNNALNIRQMESEDLDQVMIIEKEGYEFCWTRGIFVDCMKSGYSCMVLADHDDVYGYTIVMVGLEESHILNVCIAESIRGRGWARYMIQDIIDFCTSSKCNELFLEVRPSNTIAIELYHSLGFNEIGVRPGYYKAEEGREDAVLMVLSMQI